VSIFRNMTSSEKGGKSSGPNLRCSIHLLCLPADLISRLERFTARGSCDGNSDDENATTTLVIPFESPRH